MIRPFSAARSVVFAMLLMRNEQWAGFPCLTKGETRAMYIASVQGFNPESLLF